MTEKNDLFKLIHGADRQEAKNIIERIKEQARLDGIEQGKRELLAEFPLYEDIIEAVRMKNLDSIEALQLTYNKARQEGFENCLKEIEELASFPECFPEDKRWKPDWFIIRKRDFEALKKKVEK